MINVATGEIKLDDYDVILHANLTLSQFRVSDIPPLEIYEEKKFSAKYFFNARIDGMNARFFISLNEEKLFELRFWENVVLYDQQKIDRQLQDASQISHETYVSILKEVQDFTYEIKVQQKQKQDAWLIETTSALPPYEFEWGEIISLIDPRDGDVEITVHFKKDFSDGIDFRTYYKERRERWENASKPIKQLAPGELPPGFSRKKK